MSEPGPEADMRHGRPGARPHPRSTGHERAGRGRGMTGSGSHTHVEDGA